jgi:hypothetical protein
VCVPPLDRRLGVGDDHAHVGILVVVPHVAAAALVEAGEILVLKLLPATLFQCLCQCGVLEMQFADIRLVPRLKIIRVRKQSVVGDLAGDELRGVFQRRAVAEHRIIVCEVRAGQYWRVENVKSFDEFLERRFPESRRKAYYLMSIHEHIPPQARRELKEVGWTKGAGAGQGGQEGPAALRLCNLVAQSP